LSGIFLITLLVFSVALLPPSVYALFDFRIDVLVSDLTSYNIGDKPKLWARIVNTGTVVITGYDLHAVYSVKAPSGTTIAAGEGWSWTDAQPNGIQFFENTDNAWTIPNGAESGLYDILVTITSYSTGVTRSSTTLDYFSVNAAPPPDYRVYVDPTNRVVQPGDPGDSATYTVNVESQNGFTGSVDLSLSTVHVSMTNGFNPNPVVLTGTGTFTSTLTIGTTSSTPENTWDFTVTGTCGTRIHAFSGASITVARSGTPDYQISISPSQASVSQGGSVSYTVTAKSYAGYNSPVTLSALPTGSGLSLTFSGSSTATVTPTSQGVTTTLTLTASADATTGKWYFIVYGQDSNHRYRQTSATVQVNSNIQGISVSSLSTNKPQYGPSEPITFSFTVSNTGGSSVTLRPIVNVKDFGTWQASDITVDSGISKAVSLTVTRSGGWPPGVKTWGVILIGPPPTYPNLIYNMATTSTFTITGTAYTVTIYAKTTGDAPITGAEIYFGSSNSYQKYVTSDGTAAVTLPAVSASYSVTAGVYAAGESKPGASDSASPSGYVFDHWEKSGGATVDSPTSSSTTVSVSGDCVLTAYFARITVDLALTSPAQGSVQKDPPATVTAQATISVLTVDLTAKCQNAKSRKLYLRASLEGWADGSFNAWYQPTSGTSEYTIGSTGTGAATAFTWSFSSLSPAPLPGSYSVNLVVFDNNQYQVTVPPTTGLIAWKRLTWVFAFNKDQSYIEVYGSSEARIIHIHWGSGDVGDAQTVKDMLKRVDIVNMGFLLATPLDVANAYKAKHAVMELRKVMVGLVNDVASKVAGDAATKRSDGSYDIVFYQTVSGKYKGGAYYEANLIDAQVARGVDMFFTSISVFLGLMTIASIVLAVPTGGLSILVAGIALAGFAVTVMEHMLTIPDSLFKGPFAEGAHIPAYASGSIILNVERASSPLSQTPNLAAPVPSPGHAYAPDGTEFSGVTLSSVSSTVFSTSSGKATVSLNYQIDASLQGQDMQLMLFPSWGGGWPPKSYVGITGGATSQQGSATFTIDMPRTPGRHYAWIVIGLGSTFAQALQGFYLDMFSTSTPHVTFSVLPRAFGTLLSVYDSRSDLRGTYPGVTAEWSTQKSFVRWAAVFGTAWDAAEAQLGSYGYLYTLSDVYNNRPDLQSAYPEVTTGDFENLISWAAKWGITTDSSASAILGQYGHIYNLLNVYFNRLDLRVAYPQVENGDLTSLIGWAATWGSQTDAARSSLGSHGHLYALLSVYYSRSDLMNVYPGAVGSPPTFQRLVYWAAKWGITTDSAKSTLGRYDHFYVLLNVYNGRQDLQNVYPGAWGSLTAFQGLIDWAGRWGISTDSAKSTLQPYAAQLVLLRVYSLRLDLQQGMRAAFSYPMFQSLINWAAQYGVTIDSAKMTLQPYATWYQTHKT
jgi:hypothetical protein